MTTDDQPPDPDAPTPEPGPGGTDNADVGQKAKRGGKWALLGYGGGQALRLISNLILTRLIAKEAFGVFLIVRFVILAIGQFSDVGVGASIIQNKRDDADFLNTAWVLQVGRGVVMTVLATAIAWPAAQFYDEPLLFALIPFAGLIGVVSGMASTKLFTANRNLDIKRLTFVELGAQIFGTTVTIGWAFFNPSVWALAAGAVTAALGKTLLSHTIVPGLRNRFTFDRSAARALLGFGKWVFISTLLGFMATQADRAVFGRLFPADQLGVYAIAVLFAFTPQQVFRHLTLSILFPLYSQIVRSGGELKGMFVIGRRKVLLLAGPICALLLGGGPSIIDFLYEADYAAAGWMVQLLAIGTWFNALEVTDEAVTLARGNSRAVATANVVKIAAMSGLIYLGWQFGGPAGAIAGFACAEAIRWLMLAQASARAGLGGIGQAVGYTGLVALSAGAAYAAAVGMRSTGLGIVLESLVVGLVILVAWTPLGLPELKALRRS